MPRLSDVDLATDAALLAIGIAGSAVVRSLSFRRAIASALTLQLECQEALQYSWASPNTATVVYRVRDGAGSPRRALQRVLEDVGKRPLAPSVAIRKYGSGWTDMVLDEAAERGLLWRERRTLAGVWDRTTWTVKDLGRVSSLRDRLVDVLLGEVEPTAVDAVRMWLVGEVVPLSDLIELPCEINLLAHAQSIMSRPWPELPAGTALRFRDGFPRACDGG